MPFLTVNGLEVPVLVPSSPTSSGVEVGGRLRATDGSQIITRRRTLWTFTGSTPILSPRDADAFESLLMGAGDRWPWDGSLYSVKGAQPLNGYTGTVSAVGGRWDGCMTTAAGQSVGYAVKAAGGPASLSFWRFETSAWAHYLLRTDGAKWRNGARNDALSTSWLAFSLGSSDAVWTAAGQVDEGTVWPCIVPDTWAGLLYNGSTGLLGSALPSLNVAGDVTGARGTIRAAGFVSSAAFTPAQIAGAWEPEARALAFTIEEG